MKHALANNQTSAKKTFESRVDYNKEIFQDNNIAVIDLWNDKPLYGKIDGEGFSVSLLEQSTIKQLPIKEPMFCVDFVADAFKDFSRYLLNNGKKTDIISRTPTKGWESFKLTYSRFYTEKLDYFVNFYLPDRRDDVTDFNSLITVFFDYLKDTKPLVFTRSSFIKSSLCPVYVTGLVIDLQKTEKDKDIQKEKMILHPDFAWYQNTARKFGFYIDKNVPWRIVANLSSPILQDYMKPYGLTYNPNSETDFFTKYHNYTFIYELEDLRKFLFEAYTRFTFNFKDTVTSIKSGDKRNIHIVPKETIKEPPGDKLFWLNLYLRVKLVDMNIELSERELDKIIRKSTYDPNMLTEDNLLLIHQQIKNL